MLDTQPSSPGLIFGSFLYRSDLHQEHSLKETFEKHFGSCLSFSPTFNPLASYYSQEMGDKELKRVFFIPTTLFPREYLVTTKLLSLDWEKSWAIEGKRMVNIDIGFLSAENFVLATTKNYSHRVYLAQNIYADLTYYFHQNKLQTFPWTYPDYVDSEKIEFFTWLRQYMLQKSQNN